MKKFSLNKWIASALIPASLFIMACGDGSIASYPDNDGIPGNCEYEEGAHYRPNLFPRFDLNRDTLELVDWNTGDTVTVLAEFDSVSYMSVLSWSPDCRYLMTHQRGNGVIWDTINNTKVMEMDNVPNFTHNSTSITWDSTANYVTIESRGTTYLFNMSNASVLPLTDHYFTRQYWDVARNQLIGISQREIAAYDLGTGAKVATFDGLAGNWNLNFSPDGQYVAFYSMDYQPDKHIHVFNRSTMQHSTIFTGVYRHHIHLAFSPDNRYLAAGGWHLRVWDLNNLPEVTEHREPLYEYDSTLSYIEELHFVSGTTVETHAANGAARTWDIFGGAVAGG